MVRRSRHPPGYRPGRKQAPDPGLVCQAAPPSTPSTACASISAVKGGRLAAAAWPARVTTWPFPTCPGDDLAVIASGPTVADPTTAAAALACSTATASPWRRPCGTVCRGRTGNPKPGDPRLAGADYRLIASPQQMLAAAAARAVELGLTPLVLGEAIEGEAREVGKAMAGMALACRRHGTPARPPCVPPLGGETTVTLRGSGRAGGTPSFSSAWPWPWGRARHPRPGRRYRRHRRQRGQRRRLCRPGHLWPGPGRPGSIPRLPRRQRCSEFFAALGDSPGHRADADQRQRLPGASGRGGNRSPGGPMGAEKWYSPRIGRRWSHDSRPCCRPTACLDDEGTAAPRVRRPDRLPGLALAVCLPETGTRCGGVLRVCHQLVPCRWSPGGGHWPVRGPAPHAQGVVPVAGAAPTASCASIPGPAGRRPARGAQPGGLPRRRCPTASTTRPTRRPRSPAPWGQRGGKTWAASIARVRPHRP